VILAYQPRCGVAVHGAAGGEKHYTLDVGARASVEEFERRKQIHSGMPADILV
jgi:hypothetical protein